MLELQQSSAGKTSECDSFVRTMTSLEMSFESCLQEIEGTLHKVQIRQVFAHEELDEKGRIMKVLESEIKQQLNAQHAGKMAGEEQLNSLQALIKSLNRKIVELEEGNAELQSQLEHHSTGGTSDKSAASFILPHEFTIKLTFQNFWQLIRTKC